MTKTKIKPWEPMELYIQLIIVYILSYIPTAISHIVHFNDHVNVDPTMMDPHNNIAGAMPLLLGYILRLLFLFPPVLFIYAHKKGNILRGFFFYLSILITTVIVANLVDFSGIVTFLNTEFTTYNRFVIQDVYEYPITSFLEILIMFFVFRFIFKKHIQETY